MSRFTGMAAMVLLLVLSSACIDMRHGRPIVGGTTVPNPTGTISGTVTSSAGTPLQGRRVTAIDMGTDMRYDATTANTGGYTIKVPLGHYRLEVELRGGEQLARQPDETHITIGDVDAQRNFVIRG
ncbi:MAG TPA: carboxypeptidase-like regulatory domain-containing protein [Vicinamibacterales bacterium]|nr:carboxypeptidase-like regulatory domain-containing protein [Vicinamibacterales bacterium]